MQSDLEIMSSYLDKNNLHMNIKKTNFIIFPDKEELNTLNITIKNQTINKITEVKFLGLIIN